MNIAGALSPPPHSRRRNWVATALSVLLWTYQVAVSPLFGPCCRFVPSCSSYASSAINRYGAARGCWMALKRLLRCHPFHPGGWDPVP